MGLRLRTLAHPFTFFLSVFFLEISQCYLGGGAHMRLMLLRGCDDKRIFCSSWFLMPFKDQSWWPYLCVSEPPILCSAHVCRAVCVSLFPLKCWLLLGWSADYCWQRQFNVSSVFPLILALYWGLHTIVRSGFVIGWLLIQDSNSLEYVADRLNGKGAYILLDFLVVVFLAVLGWLGWQHTFLDPDTWCVQGPNFDDLCACLSQCKCMLSLFTFPKIWPCALVMLSCASVWLWWQEHIFSRCWDLIVQGPNFDELCACLSQCTFVLCERYILICYPWCIWVSFHSKLGLLCFPDSLVGDASRCLFMATFLGCFQTGAGCCLPL